MMNKKSMILAAGLMFSVATTTFSIGEQEREVLYSLHALGQDFTNIEMIGQNADMFMQIFSMNIQMLEAKLTIADKKAKKTLAKTIGIVGLSTLSRALAYLGKTTLDKSIGMTSSVTILVVNGLLTTLGTVFYAVSLHDILKERNALRDALALDQEILSKLVEMKETMVFSSPEHGAQAGNALLESAVNG